MILGHYEVFDKEVLSNKRRGKRNKNQRQPNANPKKRVNPISDYQDVRKYLPLVPPTNEDDLIA